MTPEPIRLTFTPESEDHWHQLRAADLTSTDIAALFGLSPYKTRFELWHEKRSGERVTITENERMRWGRRLEASIAEGVAEDRGWWTLPMKEYMRLQGKRIGSSFDYAILGKHGDVVELPPETDLREYVAQPIAILEVKTVDWRAFADGWTVEDDWIEAPAHIELQVQHQMLVSGLPTAYIAVLVGGNDIRVLERKADAAVHAAILRAAAEFWRSIDANEPPPPVMPDDADAVIALHQFAEPGTFLDARMDAELTGLLDEYDALRSRAKQAEDAMRSHKAMVLERIGEVERVVAGNGLTLTASMVAPSQGTLVTAEMVGTYVEHRAGYRQLRVTRKVPKVPREQSHA